MINSRKKGNNYEVKIAKEMRELGYDDCITSRFGSKMMDYFKIDLLHTDPFRFQLKAWERSPHFHNIFKEMEKCKYIPIRKDAKPKRIIKKLAKSFYNVIMWKKNNEEELVILKKKDFYEIIKMLKAEKII
tara:strand:+ start:1081 stop:1473 length:393 start_codon:yes stop_codon:yes gene_type:complete